ncbi:hypothetical protein [Xenorhabdus taiwanensis]|uniref:hypothetical protein n=1 Tax=Xenorhabdus taiwanensis TaxID=3085177 RepID=UPI0035A5DDE0
MSDNICFQRWADVPQCLLSLAGYGSFHSPPEGDPDRRGIIFVEKDINGQTGESQIVKDSCQSDFCLNYRAYADDPPIFCQHQPKTGFNSLINLID